MYKILLFIFFLLSIIKIIKGKEEPSSRKHKVENFYKELGIKDYEIELYSGYLKTNIPENELFYIFIPSQNNKEKDPLILYLDGGPGCSSLLGLLVEVGPVVISSKTSELEINEFSWVKNSSLLFIDSPAEVGFSKFKEAIHNNDLKTAENLYTALKDFYEIFSEYKKNDLFISGFSYTGIYIPYLVQQIKGIDNNDINDIQLKGILIGSPYISSKYNYDITLVETIFSHGIISLDIYIDYLNKCPHYPVMISSLNLSNTTNDFIFLNNTNEPIKMVNHSCNEVKKEIQKHLVGFPFMGIYNKCFLPSNNYDNLNRNLYLNPRTRNLNQLNNEQIRYLTEEEISILNKNRRLEDKLEIEYPLNDTCALDNTIEKLLNKDKIKELLGVNKSITFYQCKQLNYKYGDTTKFFKEHLNKLSNFSCWLFSGSEDLSVPILGTIYWIGEAKFTISKEWDVWKYKGQPKGMIQNYTNGLHYLTVKNAGHVIVYDQREVGKYIFDQFIAFHYLPKNENGKGKKNNIIFIILSVIGIFVFTSLLIFIIFKCVIRYKRVKNDIIEGVPLTEN